jgi:hypothetical protein
MPLLTPLAADALATFVRNANRLTPECQGMVALVHGDRLSLHDTTAEAMIAARRLPQQHRGRYAIFSIPDIWAVVRLWLSVVRAGLDPTKVTGAELQAWLNASGTAASLAAAGILEVGADALSGSKKI